MGRWFPASSSGRAGTPFIVLFEQDRSDEADNSILVGEDADHLGPSLDLTVAAFDRIGGVQLGRMLRRERHVGEYVGLDRAEEAGQLWQLGAKLIRNLTPLDSRRLWCHVTLRR